MSSTWGTLGLMIKHIQHRNLRLLEAKLAPVGISMIQWSALRTIQRHPGTCMHRLAELSFNSDQAFGTLVVRLMKQELVERYPGGGRIHLHRLTPKGEALLKAGWNLVEEVLAETFGPLSKEESVTLKNLLIKLLDKDYPHDP